MIRDAYVSSKLLKTRHGEKLLLMELRSLSQECVTIFRLSCPERREGGAEKEAGEGRADYASASPASASSDKICANQWRVHLSLDQKISFVTESED